MQNTQGSESFSHDVLEVKSFNKQHNKINHHNKPKVSQTRPLTKATKRKKQTWFKQNDLKANQNRKDVVLATKSKHVKLLWKLTVA